MKPSEELLATLGFSLTGVIGPINFSRVVSHFGTAQEAWSCAEKDLLACGLTQRMVTALIQVRREVDLRKKLQDLREQGVFLITPQDDQYPKNLSPFRDAPYLLYVLGSINKEDQQAVAVVGSRRQT
ncbi:DNA protecting protein DprA, partial [sediment metagenome]